MTVGCYRWILGMVHQLKCPIDYMVLHYTIPQLFIQSQSMSLCILGRLLYMANVIMFGRTTMSALGRTKSDYILWYMQLLLELG